MPAGRIAGLGATRQFHHGLLARAFAICALAAMGACRRDTPAAPQPQTETALPPVEGTLTIDGVSAAVTIVRDRSGVPHITAANQEDLFFAQGFVQAQDRLFQMDLWRRSAQGRLSEVLGANFIERDAMTRRMQYRGNLDAEWASYGADARAIATAFTRGINAWVARAIEHPSEEFVLAGWKPETWRPEDLLNRTDAFLASANAQDEVLRARLIAAVGVEQADALWPVAGGGPTVVPSGVDVHVVNYTLGELLKRAGAPPLFAGFAAPFSGRMKADTTWREVARRVRLQPDLPGTVRRVWRQPDPPGSNAWVVSGARTASGAPIVAGDPHRPFTSPALGYLVHLTAPGWNVAGATAPWLPGVAIGHNEQVAWSTTAANVDTQDLFIERLNPANERQVQYGGRWMNVEVEHDAIQVKGRKEPFEYDRLYTRHGVVVGLDRDRHLAFTLRWSGMEPGGAGELAALAIDRTTSAGDFQSALGRWKMPPADIVYADRSGRIGQQTAALVPRRGAAAGRVPAAGWTGASEWTGWLPLGALPHSIDAKPPFVVSANDNVARAGRLHEVLATPGATDIDATRHLQQDVHAWNADRLLPLLESVRADAADVERARQRLLEWDRNMTASSSAATLYAAWEGALRQLLIERKVPMDLRAELNARLTSIDPLLREPLQSRDALVREALRMAVRDTSAKGEQVAWGVVHTVTFTHPLAISEPARQRFNVGPFPTAGYADTVFAASSTSGPALRVIFDIGDWDRSVAVNAPGQSESPGSAHVADLAQKWAAGDYVPLPFTDGAIRAAAESTLTLVPNKPQSTPSPQSNR